MIPVIDTNDPELGKTCLTDTLNMPRSQSQTTYPEFLTTFAEYSGLPGILTGKQLFSISNYILYQKKW